MNYQLVLKISSNPESVKNQISHLAGVEIKEFTPMEIEHISIIQEISLDYLTQELPDDFFDWLPSNQITFIENHLVKVCENSTGTYIESQILYGSREKTIACEKQGILVKNRIFL